MHHTIGDEREREKERESDNFSRRIKPDRKGSKGLSQIVKGILISAVTDDSFTERPSSKLVGVRNSTSANNTTSTQLSPTKPDLGTEPTVTIVATMVDQRPTRKTYR